MSIDAITWVLENAEIPSPSPPGMPSAPTLTLVLIGLANHASRSGNDAYPSVHTLARYARISDRQVQRCLNALVKLGLIARGDQEQVAVTIAREDRRPTCYNLIMPRGDNLSSRTRRRGDSTTHDGVTDANERGDIDVTRTVLEPRNEPAATIDAKPRFRECIPARRQQHPQIEKLAAACGRAGLTARFDTLNHEKATVVAQSVDLHGIDALVRAALERHRPQDPARSAAAWLPVWQGLRPPRPTMAPKCGQCDEHGWLPDDALGRAVRCPCRRRAVTGSAKYERAEFREDLRAA